MGAVSSLNDRIEFSNTPGATVQDIYPGFSERINHLIDLSVPSCPPIDKGRCAYIATLTGATKPSVGDWLSRNKPPRDAKTPFRPE